MRCLAGRRPGLYTIRVDEAGDRSFHYWRSAAAARETIRAWGAEALGAAVAGCDILYFSGITLGILDDESRAGLLRIAARRRADGGSVAFDGNFRPALWRDLAEARLWAERAYAADYLALPNVACVGGSWIAPAEAIAAGDLAGIRARARAAAAL